MAIKRNENKADNSAKFEANEIKVLRAKDLGKDNVTIAIDLQVNGIKIYGAFYREGVKNGKAWAMVDLPSRKGDGGKYYSIVWFPISKTFVETVAKQIETLL